MKARTLSYAIDTVSGIVTLSGPTFTANDLDHVLRRVVTDADYRWGHGLLWDRSGLESPSLESVHGAVAAFERLIELRLARVAIVVARGDSEQYGMMRMLQLLSVDTVQEMAIFDNAFAARVWLVGSKLPRSTR